MIYGCSRMTFCFAYMVSVWDGSSSCVFLLLVAGSWSCTTDIWPPSAPTWVGWGKQHQVPNRGLWATLTLHSFHPVRQDKQEFILSMKQDTLPHIALLDSPQRVREVLLYWKWILSHRLRRGMIVGVEKYGEKNQGWW